MSKEEKDKPEPIGLFKVVLSVLAAMIGIQSDANRERDFDKGRIGHYIFVGVIVVIIFIFSLISLVNNILEESGM